MSQVRSGSQAVAAALVGSLASFSLVDVLDLLARTERIGELEVVGPEIDHKIWIDRGEIVDPSGAEPQGPALFALACIEDGWFYFTVADAPPEGARAGIATVISEIGPQVAEWRYLVAVLPFDAFVRMSTSTPADEVQIRSDQWQMLSLVGPGHTVREVIEVAGMHPLDALRTLRELCDAGLIGVDTGEEGEAPVAVAEATHGSTNGAAPATPAQAQAAAPAQAPGPGDDQFATKAPLPPFTPPPTANPIQHIPATSPTAPPSASTRWTATTMPEAAGAPPGPGFVMPPPISGDPWSSQQS